jgi:hypothetical protein
MDWARLRALDIDDNDCAFRFGSFRCCVILTFWLTKLRQFQSGGAVKLDVGVSPVLRKCERNGTDTNRDCPDALCASDVDPTTALRQE